MSGNRRADISTGLQTPSVCLSLKSTVLTHKRHGQPTPWLLKSGSPLSETKVTARFASERATLAEFPVARMIGIRTPSHIA